MIDALSDPRTMAWATMTAGSTYMCINAVAACAASSTTVVVTVI